MSAQTAMGSAPGVALTSAIRLGGRLRVVLVVLLRVVRVFLGAAGDLARYRVARWRASLVWLLAGSVAHLAGSARVQGLVVAVSCLPLLLAGITRRVAPGPFERVAAPARRLYWRCWVRRRWAMLARECGLSVQRKRRTRGFAWQSRKGQTGGLTFTQATDATVWVAPRLRKISIAGNTVTLTVRARAGQHADQLEAAAPALAATCGAVSHRVRVLSPFLVEVSMVMRETLAPTQHADSTTAAAASSASASASGSAGGDGYVSTPAVPAALVDGVRVGRRQDGTPWRLHIRGRHTLVVGCSGSGKGSVLWGIAGGLAPAVTLDLVRLWGIDLKRGVEIGFGASLFCATAYNRPAALAILRRLVEVIAARGDAMVGHSRLHTPTAGDPLHVLVIDELADLTAYGDRDERDEANRLLAAIQSQGRALGVVVVAFVQDPRKDTVPTRGLFTQTIALRLRSASEVVMVLGDGMAALAPAHQISPAHPGMGYILDEDGTIDRTRADYWPDHLVQHVAASYPAPVLIDLDAPDDTRNVASNDAASTDDEGSTGSVAGDVGGGEVVDLDESRQARQPRKPRPPRAPRKPRGPRGRAADGSDGQGAGS